mmetsp:Transcript_24792/g.57777  ORF Transcript_24792/g.57777 Transcript_24792/m.57777 type:complete len:321 (+) Transcript_24792:84-1046(+)
MMMVVVNVCWLYTGAHECATDHGPFPDPGASDCARPQDQRIPDADPDADPVAGTGPRACPHAGTDRRGYLQGRCTDRDDQEGSAVAGAVRTASDVLSHPDATPATARTHVTSESGNRGQEPSAHPRATKEGGIGGSRTGTQTSAGRTPRVFSQTERRSCRIRRRSTAATATGKTTPAAGTTAASCQSYNECHRVCRQACGCHCAQPNSGRSGTTHNHSADNCSTGPCCSRRRHHHSHGSSSPPTASKCRDGSPAGPGRDGRRDDTVRNISTVSRQTLVDAAHVLDGAIAVGPAASPLDRTGFQDPQRSSPRAHQAYHEIG